MDSGPFPNEENCEISRWEMGTLNYEGLAGFEACVDYLGGFQLEFVSISRVLNLMTCYKFECSHWWIFFSNPLQDLRSGLDAVISTNERN